MMCCPNPACHGKTVHASQADALTALRELLRRPSIKAKGRTQVGNGKIAVYRCPGGYGFHIGHRPGNRFKGEVRP